MTNPNASSKSLLHIIQVLQNVRQDVRVRLYTLLKQIPYEAAVCKSFLFGPRHDFPRSGNRNHTQDDFYQKFIDTTFVWSIRKMQISHGYIFFCYLAYFSKYHCSILSIANSAAAALIWHLLLFMYVLAALLQILILMIIIWSNIT